MSDAQAAGEDLDELVTSLIAGNRRAAGRLISYIENGHPCIEEIVRRVFPRTGKAYVIGITGSPGAGKSTLLDELIGVIREQNMELGVLAVDPNSPFSGGAILGDRIRMMRHSTDPGVYIRSMGARGHLGGLAEASQNAIQLIDAMGKAIVLVETVGVGQSELEVAGAADTTVVVIPPGLGDGVQAIKAGIMEIADIFVVNKADNPYADKTAGDIRDLLRMELSPRAWTPPIVKTIATRNQGINDLWMRIQQHRTHGERSGELVVRRRGRIERAILAIAERRLREQMLQPGTATPQFRAVLAQVLDHTMDPYTAADLLVPRDNRSFQARGGSC